MNASLRSWGTFIPSVGAKPRSRGTVVWAIIWSLVLGHSGCARRDAEGALRLGYFPNVTHAQAIVGAHEGTFQAELKGHPLKTRLFNAGPAAMEALLARELDMAYVGPGPAIAAYVRSGGRVRVIAGAAAGGAGLVAKGFHTADELTGQKVAVPQIGNTQDIALRHWAKGAGVEVTVLPMQNSEIVNLFRHGSLKAAWVPEPWVATLLAAGGELVVDERSLWPNGRFPTTVLLTTVEALKQRPEDVKAVLRAHVALTQRAHRNPKEFLAQVGDGFEALTKQRLDDAVLADAFSRMEFVEDPMADQLKVVAQHAADLGYLPSADVSGMVDRSLLDQLVPRRGAEGTGGAGPPAR